MILRVSTIKHWFKKSFSKGWITRSMNDLKVVAMMMLYPDTESEPRTPDTASTV